jgi:hypothetical protein
VAQDHGTINFRAFEKMSPTHAQRISLAAFPTFDG